MDSTANIQLQAINTEEGYVSAIQAEEIGRANLALGGGRTTKDSQIDLSVGILLHKKRGDLVRPGEALATVYANGMDAAKEAYGRVVRAYHVQEVRPEETLMVKGIVR